MASAPSFESERRIIAGCLAIEDFQVEDGLTVADRIAAAAARVISAEVIDLRERLALRRQGG